MDRGDQVTYYIHQQSGFDHSVEDALAFVIADRGENGLDLVIFPAGGPVKFERVKPYDPEEDFYSGRAYWRGYDEDVPDFSALDYVNDPSFMSWRRLREEALAKAEPEARDKVREEYRESYAEMRQELDQYYGRNQEDTENA